MPGRPLSTKLYILCDPRPERTERFVGYGSAAEPWKAPRCDGNSSLAVWLAELRALNLAPLVRFDGLPVTPVPIAVAEWVARVVAAELVAADLTVLRASAQRAS
ncbi:hypothetical protein PLANPX_1159 [Lacipirellula parvula]|uniref:Uncharacterized protein n=1 Tax=Lacipirellula parvula TaxID=2650471 RepID=A0A5K7X6S5_9BACT|nr:hypothetical protein PLANPX_1159 [Lacipirellula parvula]